MCLAQGHQRSDASRHNVSGLDSSAKSLKKPFPARQSVVVNEICEQCKIQTSLCVWGGGGGGKRGGERRENIQCSFVFCFLYVLTGPLFTIMQVVKDTSI